MMITIVLATLVLHVATLAVASPSSPPLPPDPNAPLQGWLSNLVVALPPLAFDSKLPIVGTPITLNVANLTCSSVSLTSLSVERVSTDPAFSHEFKLNVGGLGIGDCKAHFSGVGHGTLEVRAFCSSRYGGCYASAVFSARESGRVC